MKRSIKLTAVCALTTGLTLASGPGTATAGPSDFTAAPISASQAKSLAGKSARNQETTLNMYSVMTDRFANGDPSNDTGGISGGPLQHGFDATKKQFYNGGDIKGLTQKLDYIHDNPVRNGLVDLPEHYVFSSARDYYTDQKGLVLVELL